MLPFQNGFSQYMADLYASTSYYHSLYLYPPPPPPENYWNANFEPPAPNVPAPEVVVKCEEPTRTREKTRKPRAKAPEESSVSCDAAQESPDSPDLKSRQKEGRNINSNIFHQMLKSIRSGEVFDKMLDKIFAVYQLQLSKAKFVEMLQKNINKLNPYVSTAKMKFFLNVPSKPKVGYIKENKQVDFDFLKVLRILCRYYLTNVHPLYIYNKLKLQKKSKRFHVEGIRAILATFRK